jgi:hypothetical protein
MTAGRKDRLPRGGVLRDLAGLNCGRHGDGSFALLASLLLARGG